MATTQQPEKLTPMAPGEPPPDVEALIEEARRRQRKRRIVVATLVLAACAAAATYFGLIRPGGSTTAADDPGAGRLCVKNQSGWKSRAVQRPGTAPALLLTNFAFGRLDYLNGHTDHQLRWPHGGVLISISDWTQAATSAMKSEYRPTSELQIAAPDFHPFEGVRNLGQRHVRLNGRLLEVWVQARPTTATTIAAANLELAGVQVCG
jgi:hypothetical protein